MLNRRIVSGIGMGILGFLVICFLTSHFHIHKGPLAEKGQVDLSQWDFYKDRAISLDGQWECYEGQLLQPEDFNQPEGQKPMLTGYADLTTGWKLFSEEPLPESKGVRTYRLIIKTIPSHQFLGIKVDNVKMSNKLYVNGRLQGASGNPGKQDKGYSPKNAAYSTFFCSDSNRIEILLQAANYDAPFKGYMYTLVLGSQKDISFNQTFQAAIELCFSILCFFFALFYLFLYKIGNKEKSMIPSMTQFICIGIVFLFSGTKLIYSLIPDFPFELFCKVQMIGLSGIVCSILCYTNLTSKRVLSDVKAKSLLTLYALHGLFVLITPYARYSYLNWALFFCYVVTYMYILWKMWQIYRAVAPESVVRKHIQLYSICLICLMITSANHFLFVLNLFSSRIIGSVAFSLFALLSQFFLAYRFVLNHNNMIKMDQVKDEFITKTSYALKAPIESIVNVADSLIEKDNQGEKQDKETIWQTAAIKNTALNLLDIVDATLDVTLLKNDQLKLETTRMDMKVCTELVTELCNDLIKDRNIQIEFTIPQNLMLEADEKRVWQILWNLVSNSAQSMEQGTVTIWGEQIEKYVYIWVEDTGCGIPEEKQKNIFDPYVALRPQGMGLGLYLARQLARLMGGDVDLEWSRVGKGSRFVFSLPAYTGKEEVSPKDYKSRRTILSHINSNSSHDRENESGGHTVLVVDDEVFNMQTASYILNKAGYRVLTAFSGEEAIKKIHSNKVDLVILDVMMPVRSGITVCKQIREEYSMIELPVLISTMGNKREDMFLALKSGANDTISKPFEEEEVTSRVRTLIALKSTMEEALKSEFAFLQAQIKPHFLYNAINTMVSLCYTDSQQAAKLLTDFSQYLRRIFDIEYNSMTTPLRSEMEMIRAYVEIEKARFGDIIQVEYDIAPELFDIEIPPLSIQPLVENAIKHGLCKKRGGGTVWVSVKKEENILIIAVKDTGIGMSPQKAALLTDADSSTEGVGFFNVSKRIKRWKKAQINIVSEEGAGTTVTIRVQMNV